MSFTDLKCEYRGMAELKKKFFHTKKNFFLHYSLGFMPFAIHRIAGYKKNLQNLEKSDEQKF